MKSLREQAQKLHWRGKPAIFNRLSSRNRMVECQDEELARTGTKTLLAGQTGNYYSPEQQNQVG
ncbi:MAG: hypothetical protein NTW32_16130 [Chloroflexi bacterium]|nr:hypothetical protein [Chloroflexota bacterium]